MKKKTLKRKRSKPKSIQNIKIHKSQDIPTLVISSSIVMDTIRDITTNAEAKSETASD